MIEFVKGKRSFILFEGEAVKSDKQFYVEETQSLPTGYVSVINRKGIRLFFKLGAKLKEGTELIPLSKAELKSIGIEETDAEFCQTVYKSMFDVDVDETGVVE
jgi:hypothetical protein